MQTNVNSMHRMTVKDVPQFFYFWIAITKVLFTKIQIGENM